MRYPSHQRYQHCNLGWLSEMPEHWSIGKLGHLARLKSGDNITTEELVDGGAYPVYGGNGVRGYSSRFTHNGDFVLIGRQGALCGNVNYASGKFWASEHAVVVHPLVSFSNRWIAALLSSMNLNQYSISAAQPGLAVETISALRVPVPPVHEQLAIANFVDRKTAELHALVARKRALIEKLKEKRSTLISRTVTRGLPPEAARAAGLEPNPKMKSVPADWVGLIPWHWEMKSISRVVKSLQTGPFGSQLHESDFVDGGVPLINPAHIVDGFAVPDDHSSVDEVTVQRLSRHKLEPGDIIMGRRGEIGRCAVITERERGWLCGTGSLRMRIHNGDPKYFSKIIGSASFRGLLELNAVGTTMLNLNPTIVGRMLVPVPPFREQRAIAEFLDRETAKIDALVAKIEQAIERLQEYRTALITAAVTGKIDVRQAESGLGGQGGRIGKGDGEQRVETAKVGGPK